MISEANITATLSTLDVDHRRVIIETLQPERGIGPRHVCVDIGVSVPRAREILRHLHTEGVCDFGPLYKDEGMLAGRGYWLGIFGEKVRDRLLIEAGDA